MALFRAIAAVIVFVLLLGGCASQGTQPLNVEEGVLIVTSTSILADIARNIAGERGTVRYIIPIGESPEDYELLPSQLQMMNEADLVFTNGLGLEGMLERVINNVTHTPVVRVSEGVVPIPLVGQDTPDPHAWLDVRNVIIYAQNIAQALVELDAAGGEIYLENLEQYREQLTDLDRWIREQTAQIPENTRVIVVSENALKYFGAAYGFETEGIWELNSYEEGTPQQISRIIELIKARKLPALFVETTVDPRYMKMIARETGIPIAGTIYTDALGHKDSGAGTYIEMMRYNVNTFVRGLE